VLAKWWKFATDFLQSNASRRGGIASRIANTLVTSLAVALVPLSIVLLAMAPTGNAVDIVLKVQVSCYAVGYALLVAWLAKDILLGILMFALGRFFLTQYHGAPAPLDDGESAWRSKRGDYERIEQH
jgi:hypothetical protein